MKTIVNKQINYKYSIIDKYEAGIVLFGWEVKSIIRNGCNIDNSFVFIKNGEVFLDNVIIHADTNVDKFSCVEKDRARKLLLKKIEINKLIGKVEQKGFTIVPAKIYTNGKKIKVEICLTRGKSEYDKRLDIKTRELNREKNYFLKNKVKNV